MTNPGGTGMPACVSSPRLAPFPPATAVSWTPNSANLRRYSTVLLLFGFSLDRPRCAAESQGPYVTEPQGPTASLARLPGSLRMELPPGGLRHSASAALWTPLLRSGLRSVERRSDIDNHFDALGQ